LGKNSTGGFWHIVSIRHFELVAAKQPLANARFWRAPCKGGAFLWVQIPPGKRSSRK